MNADPADMILAWIGLAIAVVLLNDYGWGSLARYTLLAVIVYGLLVNGPKIAQLVERFVAGIAAAGRPNWQSSSGTW